MSFLYPFLTFLQPGILWPDLLPYRPSLVAGLVALAFGLFRRSSYPRTWAFTSKGFVCLSLFLSVQVLSVYQTGLSSMVEEFAFWVPFLLFVVFSILLLNDVNALQRYVWGMIFGSVVVIFYGIYSVPAWGGYEGTGRAGAYGMYDNHNDYSFIIVQTLPFIYMLWRCETGRLKRWMLLVSLAGCIVGMAMSLSRGGMIALVVQASLIVIIGMEGRKRLLLLPILALVGSLAISYQYTKRAENQGDRYTAEDAESSRFELWKAGANMVEAHPLLGVGSRRFYEHSSEYYELSHSQKGKNSHNSFIEILSGSGFIGLLTFLLSGRGIQRELMRRPMRDLPPVLDAIRRATLIAMYSCVIRALLDAKVYDWCFYVLGAIGIACYLLIRVEVARKSDATSVTNTKFNLSVDITRSAEPRA